MRKSAYLLISMLFLLVTTGIARADPLSVDQVKALLSDLGYDPTTNNQVVIISGLGSNKVNINFLLNDDKTSMNMFSSWAVPPEKQSRIPSIDMLKANSSSPFAFGLYGKDGDMTFDVEASYDASLVSKKMLRKAIDRLLVMIDANEPLWNTDKWPPAAGGDGDKGYKVLQAEADAAWEKAPLAIQNAVFTQDKVAGYREFTTRSDTQFKRGDTLHLYAEPINYAWKSDKPGVFNINLSADLLIKSKDGNVILDRKDFAKLSTDFTHKSKIVDFTFNISTDDSVPVADYVATMTAHDLNGGKTATMDIPFSIGN